VALAFAGCKGASEDDVIEDSLSIEIIPVLVSIVPGNSQSFYVTSDHSNISSNVIWAITGEKSSGTKIYDNGTLEIAEDETAKKITVVAKLKSDQNEPPRPEGRGIL
jgi:hypothetical protein